MAIGMTSVLMSPDFQLHCPVAILIPMTEGIAHSDKEG